MKPAIISITPAKTPQPAQPDACVSDMSNPSARWPIATLLIALCTPGIAVASPALCDVAARLSVAAPAGKLESTRLKFGRSPHTTGDR
ncbi:hypothetical protein GCM10010460_11670 [Microbacterium terrae]|nr:hypothetical protein GCM10017594_17560 [Microbacterium terrae]